MIIIIIQQYLWIIKRSCHFTKYWSHFFVSVQIFCYFWWHWLQWRIKTLISNLVVTAAAFFFFNCRAYVGTSVCGSWTRVQRGTSHVGSCSDLYTVLLFCLYCLAILVCNFACDLCCFIVKVYSVKSSVELMLYCFIMWRIKIKFSYLILLVSGITFTKYAKCQKIAKPYKFSEQIKAHGLKRIIKIV